jgi:hypothetical protein
MEAINRNLAKQIKYPVMAGLFLSGFHTIGPVPPAKLEQEPALGLQGHRNSQDDHGLDVLRGQDLQASCIASPDIGVILWDEDGQSGSDGQIPTGHGNMSLAARTSSAQKSPEDRGIFRA